MAKTVMFYVAPQQVATPPDDRKLKLTKATVQETRAVEPTLDARATLLPYGFLTPSGCNSLRKQYFLPGRVDIFLLCFAVDSRETLAHVTTRWFPEVKKLQDLCKAHGVPAPVAVLVGLKTDLRHNRDNNAVIMDYAPAVSPASGRQTAAKLGLPYVECSCRALEVQDRSDAPDSTTGLDDLPASSSGGRLAERLRQARQDIADAGETLDVASSDNDPALVLAAALATWLEAQATNAT
ncbi:uncharacterized protein MONBRDRAFT_23278 [Monosiga brevicollis MX1]|uniref:Rho GTPase n=1 Tax=Monosiga brevicollis TaxID=81824 RepID=A9USX8_MONBE|nr:uncharacterized protein MONBRDRAFT_23278 [Monosiga brevicollis MX1]EDQ91145.1 predicted protein [Monosiga brevicollis MX1]|eukprot:XP_001743567.1 hypothetical protein [Monosiga brevicollis MX1]